MFPKMDMFLEIGVLASPLEVLDIWGHFSKPKFLHQPNDDNHAVL